MAAQGFIVAGVETGRTVAEVLRRRLRLSWSQARRLVEQHRVRLAGKPCSDSAQRVGAGQRLEVLPEGASAKAPPSRKPNLRGEAPRPRQRQRAPAAAPPRLPTGVPEPVIVYADAQVLVVNKPAGLTTMRHAEEVAEFGRRARRFLPPTLADLLPALLARTHPERATGPILPIHRLDKETSGLVVFARTSEAARHLGKQFRTHTIDRCYMALVRGKARNQRLESSLVKDRGDARRGSSPDPSLGKRAVTNVRVVEELRAYTLVECRLETGRTHQVRIHLAEQGTPLCGERVYDRPLHGAPLSDDSHAKRPMLHAARLGFELPRAGKWIIWEAPLPKDMTRLIRHLRTRTHS